MTSIIPFSKNSGRRFIKVVKTSRFAFVRIKKMYPKNVYDVDLELGGGEFSLSACLGVGNKPPRKKENCKSTAGVCLGRGGHGYKSI